MKQIGKKLTLAFLALLSVVMMLFGVVTANTVAHAEDTAPVAGSSQTVEDAASWYTLDHDKTSITFRLNGGIRSYFDLSTADLGQLKNELVSAMKEIVMESILGAQTSGAQGIALAKIMPLDAGDAGTGIGTGTGLPNVDLDNFDWGNNELLHQFRDYVRDRLSDPVELEAYLGGEYDLLIDYAIDSYVNSKTDETTDLDQVYEDIQDAIEKTVDEAIDQYIENEAQKNEDVGPKPGADATEAEKQEWQQKFDAWKNSEEGKELDSWKEDKQAANKEQVAQRVEAVKENGGASISLTELWNSIKAVSVDGNAIYDGNGIHAAGVKYLLSLIPRPATIAGYSDTQMENLLSASIALDTRFGMINVDVTFGFYGNLSHIREAMRLIADHIDFAVSGNEVTLNISVPEVFSKALLKLTETDELTDAQKHKIFSLFGKTSEDVFNWAKDYSYHDLLDYLKGVNFQKWFKNFLSADFINSYFGNYIEKAFDHRLTQDDIDKVIGAFSRRAAAFADKAWNYDDVEAFLLENIPGFSRVAANTPEAFKAAVNKLLSIVNRIDWAKYDAETVHKILETSTTFNDTITSYIEEFEGIERLDEFYDTFLGYAETLFDLLPENARESRFVELYKGENKLSLQGDFTVDLNKVFGKLANVAREHGREGIADRLEYLPTLFDSTEFSYDVTVRATVPNVYKVTYTYGDKEVSSGLLPVGADVAFFSDLETVEEKYDVLFWYEAGDETVTEVTEMPAKDIVLRAATDFTVTPKATHVEGETTKGIVIDRTYNGLSNTLTVTVDGVSYATYSYQWYKVVDGVKTEIDCTVAEDGLSSYIEVKDVADSATYYAVVTDNETKIEHSSEEIGVFDVTIGKYVIKFYDVAELTYSADGKTFAPYATATLVYNGKPYTVALGYEEIPEAVLGELTEEDILSFSGNTATDADTYIYKVTLLEAARANFTIEGMKEDYTLELAKWTIAKLEITVEYELTAMTAGSETLKGVITYTYAPKTTFAVDWTLQLTSNNTTDYDEDALLALLKVETAGLNATAVSKNTATLTIALKEADKNIVLKVGTEVKETIETSAAWKVVAAAVEIDDTKLGFTIGTGSAAAKWTGSGLTNEVTYDGKTADDAWLFTFAVTGNTGTNVKTYTAKVIFTLKDAANYVFEYDDTLFTLKDGTLEYAHEWEIAALEIEAPSGEESAWSDLEFVYGETIDIAYNGFAANTESYFDTPVYAYTDSEGQPVDLSGLDAGTYTVSVTLKLKDYPNVVLKDSAEYDEDKGIVITATFTVIAKELDLTGAKWTAGEGYTQTAEGYTVNFDGQAKALTIDLSGATNLTDAEKTGILKVLYALGMEAVEAADVTAVGTYTVKAGTTSDNYTVKTGTLAETKLIITGTAVTVALEGDTYSFEATGAAITVTPVITPDGTNLFTVTNGTGEDYTVSATAVGSYRIVITLTPAAGNKLTATETDNVKFVEQQGGALVFTITWEITGQTEPETITVQDTWFVVKPTTRTYTGSEQTVNVALASSFTGKEFIDSNIVVTGNAATQIGKYDITVTIKLLSSAVATHKLVYGTAESNAQGELTVTLREAWAIVADTGINVNAQIEGDSQFTYDGQPHSVTVTTFVAAGHENDVEITKTGDTEAKTEIGTYTITVKFTVKAGVEATLNAQSSDVTISADKKEATFTLVWKINGAAQESWPLHQKFYKDGQTAENAEIEVEIVEGTVPKDYTASITDKKVEDYLEDIGALEQFKGMKVVGGSAYDVHFEKDGTEQTVNGKFKVRILIPEELRSYDDDHLAVIHIHGSEITVIETAVRNNNYMEFEVTGFSVFAVIGLEDVPATNWWLIGGLALIALLLLIALIVLCVFAAKVKYEAAAAEEETAVEATEEAAEEAAEETAEKTEEAAEETEAAEAVTAEAAEEAEPVVEAEAVEAEEGLEEAPVSEEAEEETYAEEETGAVVSEAAAQSQQTMEILDKSFTARLSQLSGDLQTKSLTEYYNELKNYLLSFEGVHSRISWSYDSFNKGRVKLAKIQLKGKSIYLYVALDCKSVEEKFHCKDVSDVAKFAEVPTKIKVRSARSLKYAKTLIDIVMAANEIEQGTIEAVDYSLPYKSNDQLIADGEIKRREVTVPEIWNMDAADVVENTHLPDVELPEEAAGKAEKQTEDE